MRYIKFYLPDFTRKLNINLAFVHFKNNHRDLFYDDTKIASLYGSFPNALWNGGRCEFGDMEFSKCQDIVEHVNSLGIAIRYTFTNNLIKKEHLSDEYCNRLMSICDNGMNEVLVNSPILEQYLRLNYPRFKYILSTTSLTRGSNSINDACLRYDLVVADYRDVQDRQFLQDIIMRNKVEILLNESCLYECKYRKDHYTEISRAQLLSSIGTEPEKNCRYHDSSKFREAYISTDKLYNELVPLGFKNFKIRGRESDPKKLLNDYITYLIKPEYREIARDEVSLLLRA